MDTYCHIAIEDSDGSVRYIFCQCNGYPRHMAPILKKDYTTRESVDALIRAGGMVSLQFNDTPMEHRYPTIGVASTRWEFEDEWRCHNHVVSYLYIFTHDDVWECYCNGYMSLDDICSTF